MYPLMPVYVCIYKYIDIYVCKHVYTYSVLFCYECIRVASAIAAVLGAEKAILSEFNLANIMNFFDVRILMASLMPCKDT